MGRCVPPEFGELADYGQSGEGRLLGAGVEDRAELGGTGGGKGIMPGSLWEVLLKWLLTSPDVEFMI